VFGRIEQLEKPVVAAVNGFALGGGCELALACHLRLASTRARFGQPEVKLGILPGFGGTQRLPRLVGRGAATRLILSGEMIAADEALRIGLCEEVAAPDALLERARELLETILANGPRAIAASLAAIRDGLSLPLDAALEVEARAFSALCGSDEMREGTTAFLEKREPKF
jgi:enoyl-CoA hydratase